MRRLSPRARTVLYVGVGTFAGIALGMLILDSSAFGDFLPAWLVLFALFLGGVALTTLRGGSAEQSAERAARPVAVQGAAAAPQRPAAPLGIDFAFPDVPVGYPPVLGVDEPLHVRLAVRGPDGASEGAAVRLTGSLRDGARFVAGEGVTGTDGTVTFTLRAPSTGELLLEAEASLGATSGAGRSSVSIVRYSEEIERLFAEFRSYAHSVIGADSRFDTARELAEKLRSGADAQSARALLELARVYELVAYGERDADRRLYLQLVSALLVLERAPDRGAAAASAAPHGGPA